MNKQKNIFKIVCLLPLFLVLALVGCSRQATNDTGAPMKTIKLGIIMPLSGDAAAYGEQGQRVVDYYLPQINERYKDKNIRFEAVYEDGKCAGNDAVSALQKLTDIDGAKFIIGGFCSSETLAIAPLTKDGHVLAASIGSSNTAIEGASPYLFTFSYRDDVVANKIAIETSKYKTVAIISEQNDYNVGMRKNWLTAMKAYPDTKVVIDETFPKGATDFRSILEKVKKQNPEIIFLNPNAGATAQDLLKQLAEIKDWNSYKLISIFSYASPETLKAAPAKSEGMTIVDSPSINNQELLTIKKDIETKKGTLADLGTYYTAATIDTLNVVTSLIVELGEDPKTVRQALVTRDFKGYISDDINFKNSNFTPTGAAIYVVKNGVAELQK
ncbi:MAG: ABC transporter substrate-binding protein [Patescibacteria group bacterium]